MTTSRVGFGQGSWGTLAGMPERSTKLTHKDAMALVVLGLFALAL
jgi:hypothetical protein